MKRRIIMIILCLVLACIAVVLAGCDKVKVDKGAELMHERVSYIERGVYGGADSAFDIKLLYGDKEENFVADGKVVNSKPFATLTVAPLNLDGATKTYKFRLVGSKGEVAGDLSKNLLGASYGINMKFDKGGIVDNIGEPQKVVIAVGDKNADIALANTIKEHITADKAIDYAYGALKEYVQSITKDGQMDGEVYVRLIRDRNSNNAKSYWYVAIMRDSRSFANALIDPTTGAVASVKLPQQASSK